MVEAVLMLLIWACVLALVVYVVLWVLGQIGVTVPPQIVKVVWIIVALVVLLMIVRLVVNGVATWPLVS